MTYPQFVARWMIQYIIPRCKREGISITNCPITRQHLQALYRVISLKKVQ